MPRKYIYCINIRYTHIHIETSKIFTFKSCSSLFLYLFLFLLPVIEENRVLHSKGEIKQLLLECFSHCKHYLFEMD